MAWDFWREPLSLHRFAALQMSTGFTNRHPESTRVLATCWQRLLRPSNLLSVRCPTQEPTEHQAERHAEERHYEIESHGEATKEGQTCVCQPPERPCHMTGPK